MTKRISSDALPPAQSSRPHAAVADWQVKLDVNDSGLSAAIVGLEASGPWEFAFYLMCGRERRDMRWYSEKPTTFFEGVHAPDKYHVIGFARHPVSKEGGSRRSEEVVISGGGYDPTAWKLSLWEYPGFEAFWKQRSLADGIHRIDYGNGATLDLLTAGLHAPRTADAALVGFSAANKRTAMTAPIFSGVSLSRRMGMPLIAVADPLVSAHDDLTLAWYAGGERWPQLPERIAATLDHISRLVDVPLILFGGSGGGFAALCVQQFLNVRSSACVWNPQTSITRYHRQAVAAYARHALPRRLGGAPSPPIERVVQALDEAGVHHDLTRTPLGGNQPIIYLQNESDDFHVNNHLIPFAQAQGASQDGVGVVNWSHGERCFALARWGQGHAKPPTPITADLLLGLAKNIPVEKLVRSTLNLHAPQSLRAS